MENRSIMVLMGVFLVVCLECLAGDEISIGDRTYKRVEFGISDGSAASAKRPSVAYSFDGASMMFAWDTGNHTYSRAFAADGTPLTGDTVVGGSYSGLSDTWYANIAAMPGNAFIVATEHHPSYYVMDIYARKMADDGSVLTDFFQVNSYTDGAQKYPRVAANGNGESLIVWQSYWPAGSDLEIVGRRFDAAGNSLTDEWLVNSSTIGQQDFPKIAMNAAGAALVVWRSVVPAGTEIRARRFDSTGLPYGDDYVVSGVESGVQKYNTSVAMNASGEAVVAWGESSRAYVQRYSSTGEAVGSEIEVTEQAYQSSLATNIGMWDNGEFVVTWWSKEGDYRESFARIFNADGTPLGATFDPTISAVGNQYSPEVACGPDGSMVFVWQQGGDDSRATIYTPEPATMILLAGGLPWLLRRRRKSR